MKPDPIINPKHYTLCSRRVTTRALVALRICFSFLWIRFTLHTQGLARYPDGCGGGRSSFDPRSSRCLLARRGGARVTQHELGWLTDSAAILTSERSSRHPPSRALRRASRLISTSFHSVVSSCYWVWYRGLIVRQWWCIVCASGYLLFLFGILFSSFLIL